MNEKSIYQSNTGGLDNVVYEIKEELSEDDVNTILATVSKKLEELEDKFDKMMKIVL